MTPPLILGLLTAALVLGLLLVYVLLKRRMDREIRGRDPVQEVRDELGSIMVEINRTTEQNVAILEDRIEQLKKLTEDADKKIGLLRREIEKHEVSRQVYSNIVRPPRGFGASPASSRAPETRRSAEERRRADEESATEDESSDTPEPLDKQVMRLSREGFSAEIIAGRVGTTVGEVELIISLYNRRK